MSLEETVLQESLLKEIWTIAQKFELISQKSGENFNIFEIANVETKEVIICRILGELLNPKGKHSMGSQYLEKFVEDILGKKDFNYDNANVYLEYLIQNNRRIDIVLCDGNYFIPIEVKINAGDQENQCNDYLKYAKNSDMYYLTLFGVSPSVHSYNNANNNTYSVKELSFELHILKWLTSCVEDINTLKIAPIREVLLQLIRTIKKLTNQLGDECKMETKDLLTKSCENMKSAILLEKSLIECKKELLENIFKELKGKLEKNSLGTGNEKVEIIDDFSGVKIEKFYNYTTCPSISFLVKENIQTGIDLLLKVEIDKRIYAGFVLTKEGAFEKGLLTTEIRTILKDKVRDDDPRWAYYEYLPNGDNGETSPNFKEYNEEYFKLYDETYFNDFIDKSVKVIVEMCNNI